jgi:hypothetical protein
MSSKPGLLAFPFEVLANLPVVACKMQSLRNGHGSVGGKRFFIARKVHTGQGSFSASRARGGDEQNVTR